MAFPVNLDGTQPANTENPNLGASRIRAVTQAILDLFNLPSATNIGAALAITRVGPYTNQTGVTLNAGDVVALDLANDASVALSDVQGSLRQFVVALATITSGASGVFGQTGQVTVTTQGAVTRGNYLRKSATTKALEDTGTAPSAITPMPTGTVGVALTGTAGPGASTVVAQLFGATAAPPFLIGSYGVRNLIGQNDGTSPNTKFGYSADLVALRNPTTGALRIVTNTGTLTNDTSQAQVTNGRDQAGAFSSSSWIHFYFVGTGIGAATTLSSASPPPTGPTLLTGQTEWAYAGAVRYNATPLLVKTRFMGSHATYDAMQAALTSGAATGETAISFTALIPPNAVRLVAWFNSKGTGNNNNNLHIRTVSGTDYQTIVQISADNSDNNFMPWAHEYPNLSQQLFYHYDNSPGIGLDVAALGYVMPNGGE